MPQRVSLGDELVAIARESIAALEGACLTAAALAVRAPGPRRVWAVGKAAAAMARGAAEALGAELSGGLVITKRGHGGGAPAGLRLCEAGHPLPDDDGVAATAALLAEADALEAPASALLLLSGGASALLAAPVEGVSLSVLKEATRGLMSAGASIHEVNIVRRHLGAALGGRLGRRAGGALEVLALSDVLGDDPATIGSGPAAPDPSTLADARRVARRYRLGRAVVAALDALGEETPKPGDPLLEQIPHRILASPETLGAVAADLARARGWSLAGAGAATGPVAEPVAPIRIEGDVEQVAVELLERAAAIGPGELLVAFGEPTVRVSGRGRGGRAQQLALLMARGLEGLSDLAFVACGSDGSDGPTDAAGAVVSGGTVAAARDRGLDAGRALADCDAYPLLAALDALVFTGPTGTNLTDLILLGRAGKPASAPERP